jgi:uncharacterized protein (TIGR02646 family)
MIRLQRPPLEKALDEETRAALAQRHSNAAALLPRDGKITSRWDSFTQGRGKDRGVGPRVCERVRDFCRHKCAFCEAPSPATVDHFWPKMEYPGRMFEWANLLAACRDCNSEKRARFPLENHGARAGKPLLIDPTEDEPLAFFRWDPLDGSCLYEDTNGRAAATATTISMDRFRAERMHKLRTVRFLLARCIREPGVPQDLREQLRDELGSSRPYLCILRSYFLYPPRDTDRLLVRRAIQALPELLDWVRPWLLPPMDVSWPPA